VSRLRRIGLGVLVLVILGAAGSLLPLDERVLSARAVPLLLDRQLEWAAAQPGYPALESLRSSSSRDRSCCARGRRHRRSSAPRSTSAWTPSRRATARLSPGSRRRGRPAPLDRLPCGSRLDTECRHLARARRPGDPERDRRAACAPERAPPAAGGDRARARRGRLLLALGAGAAAGLLLSGISLASAVFSGADGRGAAGRDLLLALAMAAAMAGVIARSGGWAALAPRSPARARGARRRARGPRSSAGRSTSTR